MFCRIIARLDIKSSSLVKGIHLEGLRVLGKPEQFADFYYHNGADELIFMDAVASLYNRNSLSEIIRKTARKIFIPLTVGGGIRTIADINKVLRSGADKVAINTAAIKNPAIISKAVNIFGSSTIVLSIEAKKQNNGYYEAYIDNGRQKTGIEVIGWAKKAEKLGVGEIIITSIDQEGTGEGFNVFLVKKLVKSVSVPVVASGGAGKKEDVEKLIKIAKPNGICLASLIHYNFLKSLPTKKDYKNSPYDNNKFSKINDISILDLKKYLLKKKIQLRSITKN